MPIDVVMPRLGMSMQEGVVVAWQAQPPARVERGQILLVIESEKTEAEIEAPAAGVLRHVYVEPGETVPCGTLLAVLTESLEAPFDAEAYRRRVAPAPAPSPSAPVEPRVAPVGAPRSSVAPATPGVGPRGTPAARKRATALGLDLSRIVGTGPRGRITREDVEALAGALGRRVEMDDGAALEVVCQGEGVPVVLVPGFGTDVSAFARQLPVLAARYRVLAMNPRGVGLSDALPTEGHALEILARDAGTLLGKRGHLIGASLGAAAALELALSHPELVRSLTLITPFVRASARLRMVVEVWRELAAAVSPQVLARAILPWLFSERFLADAVGRERMLLGFAQGAARIPAETLARQLEGLEAWDGTRTPERSKLSVPTLIVAAGADLLTTGAAELADSIAQARLIRIEGAGHAVTLEAADEVNAALLEHLQAVDSREGV